MTERNTATPAQHPVTEGRGGGATTGGVLRTPPPGAARHVPPPGATHRNPTHDEYVAMTKAMRRENDAMAASLAEDAEHWLAQRRGNGPTHIRDVIAELAPQMLPTERTPRTTLEVAEAWALRWEHADATEREVLRTEAQSFTDEMKNSIRAARAAMREVTV